MKKFSPVLVFILATFKHILRSLMILKVRNPFLEMFRALFCRSFDVLQLKTPRKIVQYVVTGEQKKNGGIPIVMCQMLGLQMVSDREHVRC